MEPETARRWLEAGRIITAIAVTSMVMGLVLVAILFPGGRIDVDAVSTDVMMVFLIGLMFVVGITGIAGPAAWTVGLYQSKGAWWPPILVFAVMATAFGLALSLVLDYLFRGLGNFF